MSKMLLKKNNHGVIVVETSIIMPLILGVIFIAIFGFVYVYNVETARSELYSALYTIPPESIGNTGNDTTGSEDEIREDLIQCDPQIVPIYMDGNIIWACNLDLYDQSVILVKTEYGLCTDRLRRWQLYGDFAEE